MNTKSILVRSFGVVMALLMFVSLPTTTLAICGYAQDPYCELYYGTGTNLFLELNSDNPDDFIIFYTYGLDHPPTSDPCHVEAVPCSGTLAAHNEDKLSIPFGHTVYVRAIAWKHCWPSVNVVSCEQHNPNG